MSCRLLPAREAQKRFDAGLSLRVGTGRKDYRAIVRIVLTICGCLLMPFNCAAETPALTERNHLQVEVSVDGVESSATQQRGVNSVSDVIPFFSSVLGEREPMAQERTDKNTKRAPANDRPRAGEYLNSDGVQWLYAPIAFAICFLLGFAFTYR